MHNIDMLKVMIDSLLINNSYSFGEKSRGVHSPKQQTNGCFLFTKVTA